MCCCSVSISDTAAVQPWRPDIWHFSSLMWQRQQPDKWRREQSGLGHDWTDNVSGPQMAGCSVCCSRHPCPSFKGWFEILTLFWQIINTQIVSFGFISPHHFLTVHVAPLFHFGSLLIVLTDNGAADSSQTHQHSNSSLFLLLLTHALYPCNGVAPPLKHRA